MNRQCGFYLLMLDLLKDFSFSQFRKETVNESFSVGIMLPPLTVLSNRYMLDSYSNKQNERWGGLKTPHHQEP